MPKKQKLNLMGYYGNYETYGREYQPEDIDFSIVDGVLYAFAQVGNCMPDASIVNEDWDLYNGNINTVKCRPGSYATAYSATVKNAEIYSTDPYSDFYKWGDEYKAANDVDSWWNGKGNMAKVIKYAHDHGSLALLSIGGWSSSISLLWAIKNKPSLLVDNILKFINEDLLNKYFKYDINKPVPVLPDSTFDGVDIDLEPYANHWDKMSKDEINSFVDFISLLRSKLGKDKVLSIAISGSLVTPESIKAARVGNMEILGSNVDKLFLMSYDYHGAFDDPSITNFHAPLYFDYTQPVGVEGRKIYNAQAAVLAYVGSGFPADKIVLGYPSYGRALRDVASKTSQGENIKGLYQSFDPDKVPTGQYDNSGVWDYIGIKNKLLGEQGYKESFSKKAGAVMAYSEKDKVFISYDNPQSVALKTCFAQKAGLNGMFTWTLAGDKEKDLVKSAHKAIINGCSQESKSDSSEVYKSSYSSEYVVDNGRDVKENNAVNVSHDESSWFSSFPIGLDYFSNGMLFSIVGIAVFGSMCIMMSSESVNTDMHVHHE